MKTNPCTSSASSYGLSGHQLSANQWVKARYAIEAKDWEEAVVAIVRGQTIGNPSVVSPRETPRLLDYHLAKAHTVEADRVLDVYYPKRNFGREGVNYMMSVVMGGQCDIDNIHSCRLIDLDLTAFSNRWRGPRYGIEGIRKIINVYGRPLFGGIIKPKIGLSPQGIADVCKEMADGGIDFIKEDEILADQEWCSMRARIQLVEKALRRYGVIYAPCITGDGKEILHKARVAREFGASAIHLNIWCSLGAYHELRNRVNLPIFFQKSGDKVWTTGPFSIDFKVICKIVNKIGCDFAHVGMWGGYMAEPYEELKMRIQALGNTIPSFSCGVKPEHVGKLRQLFGNDIMISSGGYLAGHPKGITAAVREFHASL